MSDLSITAANVVGLTDAAHAKTGTAGIAITQGEVAFFDQTTGKWWLATSNASPGAGANNTAQGATTGSPNGYNTQLGIALNSASPGQPVLIQTNGLYTVGSTVVVGEQYFLSTTASTGGGGIVANPGAGTGADASGTWPAFLGFGVNTTQINLQPASSPVAHA
jgi:hypothetical protein